MTTAIGAIGAALILLAFLANLTGQLSRSAIRYQATNALGAGILVWYGLATGGYVFVALEGIWALAAVFAIYNHYRHRESAQQRAS